MKLNIFNDQHLKQCVKPTLHHFQTDSKFSLEHTFHQTVLLVQSWPDHLTQETHHYHHLEQVLSIPNQNYLTLFTIVVPMKNRPFSKMNKVVR